MNIILDFDGTIADSFGLIIEIFQQMIRGGKPLSEQEIERLRGLSPLQITRELNIKPWRVPFLLARGRARMRRHMKDVHAIRGMPEAIKELAAAGHNLYIMSSNSAANIHLFLRRHDMDGEFIKIYGGVGIFGKARMLRRVLRENGLEGTETYYIGDEVRDIEAAQRVGVRMIAVAWGFNNTKALGAHEPDFLAQKPGELAGILKVHGK